MAQPQDGVEVKIMGASYVIRGHHDPAHLRAVAAYVNEQMTALGQKSRITSTPKLAVLTALNLAEEVFRLRAGEEQRLAAKERLAALEQRVAELLAGSDADAPAG